MSYSSLQVQRNIEALEERQQRIAQAGVSISCPATETRQSPKKSDSNNVSRARPSLEHIEDSRASSRPKSPVGGAPSGLSFSRPKFFVEEDSRNEISSSGDSSRLRAHDFSRPKSVIEKPKSPVKSPRQCSNLKVSELKEILLKAGKKIQPKARKADLISECNKI